jgi:organic hydroperoxide reductase OsmC/OhrA
VTAYEDNAEGMMVEEASGAGYFTRVVLQPRVSLAAGSDRNRAAALHHKAHEMCFIARSVNVPVEHHPVFTD